MEDAHSLHHLEPAPWNRSFEAVCGDHETRDCAHRSDAALWKRSCEAVYEAFKDAHSPYRLEAAPRECSLEAVEGDIKLCDCAHRSDAALWKRSCDAVYHEDIKDAHSPYRLEAAPRERSLEAVCADLEVHDCAHRSDAALWK
eukprot:2699808-Amphidinium_carterae.1